MKRIVREGSTSRSSPYAHCTSKVIRPDGHAAEGKDVAHVQIGHKTILQDTVEITTVLWQILQTELLAKVFIRIMGKLCRKILQIRILSCSIV